MCLACKKKSEHKEPPAVPAHLCDFWPRDHAFLKTLNFDAPLDDDSTRVKRAKVTFRTQVEKARELEPLWKAPSQLNKKRASKITDLLAEVQSLKAQVAKTEESAFIDVSSYQAAIFQAEEEKRVIDAARAMRAANSDLLRSRAEVDRLAQASELAKKRLQTAITAHSLDKNRIIAHTQVLEKAPSVPLPPGWRSGVCPNTNMLFYWHARRPDKPQWGSPV